MPEQTDPYAIQYSESGRTSRKELPPEAMSALFDVLDALAANPDAFPGRVRKISRDGNIRLYSHPSPPLQVTFEVDTSRQVLYLQHFVCPKVQVTKPVFISYSHKDAKWLEKLKQFLRPLEDQELIRVWDDTEIRAGSDWLGDIRKALESARVAVFLVTQNFLDSPFINEHELPKLIDAANSRGCLIFWIQVSSTTFEDSPLAKFQGVIPPNRPLDLMSDAEQSKVLVDIYRKMKEAVSV
jgi:TIR domain-containing protein